MRRGIVITDLFAVTTALLASHVLLFGVAPPVDAGWLYGPESVLLLGPTLTVGAFVALGLYRHRPDSEAGRVVVGVTAAIFASFVIPTFWANGYVPRSWLVLSWGLACVLVIATRAAWRLGPRRPIGSRGAN